MFSPKTNKTKSTVPTILLVFIIAVFVFGTLRPVAVSAQWVTADPVQHALTFAKTTWDKIQKNIDKWWKRTASRSYQQAIRSVSYKLAQDAALYISTGGKGQKPLTWKNVGKYIEDLPDVVAGKFLSNLTAGWPINICQPSSIQSKLAITIGLGKSLDELQWREGKISNDTGLAGCTLGDITNNWSKAVKDEHFLDNMSIAFEPGKNDLSVSNILWNALTKEKEQTLMENTVERLQTGDLTMNDTGAIFKNAYPEATYEQLQALQEEAFHKAFDSPPRTEDILVDTLAVFANTLSKAYLQKLKTGFYPFRSSSSSRSPDSEISGSAGSTRALLASFDVFSPERAAEVQTSGEIDLFDDIINCPSSQYQSPYNCLLPASMQAAVQQGLTVAQAVAQKAIVPDLQFPEDHDPNRALLSLENLRKLRFLRVIPVGWELAAQELINRREKMSFGSLLACFESASPDCQGLAGLVDPKWVLSLPEFYCQAEGYGNIPEHAQSPNRQKVCVDLQSCVREDSSGNCQTNGYGYCTRERQIWQLTGQKCDQQFATCLSLRSASNSAISLLGSDVNREGCTQTNAGCAWYSTTPSATGWDSSHRIYLTNLAPSCRSGDAGSREIIPLEPGINLARNDNASQTIEIKPYTYYTLSFTAPASVATAAQVVGTGIVSVSFSAPVAGGFILNVPSPTSASRYAATFYSNSAQSVNLTFTGGTVSGVQLEEVSLADGQRAREEVSAHPAAGVGVLNVSPTGKRNSASPATEYKPYQNNRRLVFAGAKLCGEPNDPEARAAFLSQYPVGNPEETSARKYTSLSSSQTKVARLMSNNLCPKECSGLESFLDMPTPLEILSGSSAVPTRVSFIPEQVQSCSASEAGCEEFTSLAATNPESRQYYRQIRSCVLDSNSNVATFYTWEGTDTAGFQLKAWQLLRDSVATSGKGFGPCANFLAERTLTTDSRIAECEGGSASEECVINPDDPDPNCRVFLDEQGREYRRDTSKIVAATPSCQAFRRSASTRDSIWYFSPEDAQSCSASAVGCREYKGGRSNLARRVLSGNFEQDTGGWTGGTKSEVSFTVPGSSLGISAAASASFVFAPGTVNFAGKTYILNFDAKADGASGSVDLALAGKSQPAPLSAEWSSYSVGPFYFEFSVGGSPELLIRPSGADVYIDNIELLETEDRVFALEKSTLPRASGGAQPDACYNTTPAYESCQAWRDDSNNTFFVSRFDKLFGPESLYCRAVIDTQNSDSPEAQEFNPGDPANYPVSQDRLEYRLIKPDNLRPNTAAGCKELGVPNNFNSPTSWTVAYKIIDPDSFGSGAMCRAEGLGCQSFSDSDGGTYNFRDPGQNVCGWDSNDASFKTLNSTGNLTNTPCPRNSVGLCPAEQSGCTAYLPANNDYSEGGMSALFMLAPTVEAGDCKAGDSIEAGCASFTENATSTSPRIKENLLARQQTKVLTVKPQRQCAEWLAPTTTSEVNDPAINSIRTVVYDLGRCQAADAKGRCTQWVNQSSDAFPEAYKPDGSIVRFQGTTYATRSHGQNIYSGAWDYSGYSIPNQYPIELLQERIVSGQALLGLGDDNTAATLSCRAYPEEDSPFDSSGIPIDSSTGKKIFEGAALEKLNLCQEGKNCQCSYKKVASDEQGNLYYSLNTQSTLPADTRSITNLTGWQGYCVEEDQETKDPNGQPACLAWWPKDVIQQGVNIFDNHPEAGFTSAGPQYYCLQAKGNKLDGHGLETVATKNNNYFVRVNDFYVTEDGRNFLPFNYSHADDGDHTGTARAWPFITNYSERNGWSWKAIAGYYLGFALGGPGGFAVSTYLVGTNKVPGWEGPSGLLKWPVNKNSLLKNLREYDIEAIILKVNARQDDDWPAAGQEIILKRDGYAKSTSSSPETTDRWTAFWCTSKGEGCEFNGVYTWDKFLPFIARDHNLATDDGILVERWADQAEHAKKCGDGSGNTNLLTVRARFADKDGNPGPENCGGVNSTGNSSVARGCVVLPAAAPDDTSLAADQEQDTKWGGPYKANQVQGPYAPYQFLGLEGGLCDGSGGEGWASFEITLQLREWCSVVAEIDSTDNKAWTGRLNQKSIISYNTTGNIYKKENGGYFNHIYATSTTDIINDYKFSFNQDNTPFGAMVPPISTIYTPNLWDSRKNEEEVEDSAGKTEIKLLEPGNQPLYVEAPNKQARAGSPYSCSASGQCVIPPTDKGLIAKRETLDIAKTYLLQLFGKIKSLWNWNPSLGAVQYQLQPNSSLDLATTHSPFGPNDTGLPHNEGEFPMIQGADCYATTNNCLTVSNNGNKEVTVEFFAYNKNGEQLPLKEIRITWDDGTATQIKGNFKNHKPTTVCDNNSANYGNTNKACEPKPFQFKHVYGDAVEHNISVSVTDNWARTSTATGVATPVVQPEVPEVRNGGWSNWGTCSAFCGAGTQARVCNNPAPANGGTDCSTLDGGNSSQPCPLPACTALVINSAFYGFEDRIINVTEKVRNLVSNNVLNVRVRNSTFGVSDPAFGYQKKLTVEYTFNGVSDIKSGVEETIFKLP